MKDSQFTIFIVIVFLLGIFAIFGAIGFAQLLSGNLCIEYSRSLF